MGKTDGPRHGSMQFWPRKRAKRETPRVRSQTFVKDSPIDGFYGYKVGMTQLSLKDNYANSVSKNKTVIKPATIIECPPLKVAGIRFYTNSPTHSSLHASTEVFADKLDKNLSKRLNVPKAKPIPTDVQFDSLRLLCYTQPALTGIGKKTPEFFEVAVKGNKEEQLAYATEKFGKEIDVTEVLQQHELVDVHGITTGKGYQGPVKRFGIQIRSHKSEKTKRGPGSLGPWKAQQHIMYRIAHAGQTGYHLRTEYNKPIIFMGNEAEKVNVTGGFVHYGVIKNPYIIVLGSVSGPKKRMVRLTHAQRPNDKLKTHKLELLKIMQDSQQR